MIQLGKSEEVNSKPKLNREIVAIITSLVDDKVLGEIAIITLGNINGASETPNVYNKLMNILRNDKEVGIRRAVAAYALRETRRKKEVASAVLEFLRTDLRSRNELTKPINLAIMTLREITGKNHKTDT